MGAAYGTIAGVLEGTVQDIMNAEIASYVVAGASNAKFGTPAYASVNDADTVTPKGAGGTVLLGVFARTAKEPFADGTTGYAPKENANIIKKGYVWVPVSLAVQANAKAAVASDGLSFVPTGTASSVDTAWFFRTSASAGGLALLETIVTAA